MISLNTSSPYLQTEISSGYDSVSQGIAQISSSSGTTGLQSAYDSFSSFETTQMGDFGAMGSQQLLAPSAAFSSPVSYIQSQVQDSAVQNTDPLLKALQDSHLATGDELSKVSGILSQFASEAAQQGIIIVSGSPTEVDRAGINGPPIIPSEPHAPQQFGTFDQLQQGTSSKLEQAGVFAPPQVGGSSKFEQAGLITPPQVGGSSKLEQAGLMTPPQFGGSTKLDQVGLMTPPQVGDPTQVPSGGMFAELQQQGITLSTQDATALTKMSKTVREASSLFQDVNVSMLSRRIVG